MGKDFKDFDEKFEHIQQMRREVEKEEKKLKVRCPHQSRKGNLKVDFLNDRGDCRCRKCGETFNMNKISEQDISDAMSVLHNAIQQIRCFADPDDDRKLIMLLGESDYNMRETANLYGKMVNAFGKGGKKKDKFRDNRDNFGSYGFGNISFIDHKKKNKY